MQVAQLTQAAVVGPRRHVDARGAGAMGVPLVGGVPFPVAVGQVKDALHGLAAVRTARYRHVFSSGQALTRRRAAASTNSCSVWLNRWKRSSPMGSVARSAMRSPKSVSV